MPAGVEKKPSTFLLGMFPPSEEANYPSLHLRGMPPRKAAARRRKKAVDGKGGVCQVTYLLEIVLPFSDPTDASSFALSQAKPKRTRRWLPPFAFPKVITFGDLLQYHRPSSRYKLWGVSEW